MPARTLNEKQTVQSVRFDAVFRLYFAPGIRVDFYRVSILNLGAKVA